MYLAMFYDVDIGKVRTIYATDLNSLVKAMELYNIDYVEHFVKVRYRK